MKKLENNNNDPIYVTLEQLMAVEARVTLLEQRLSGIEQRLSRIEGILEQMDKRIDDLKKDLRLYMGISLTLFASVMIPMLLRFLEVI